MQRDTPESEKRSMRMMIGLALLVVALSVQSICAQTKKTITEITFEETSSWQGLMGRFVLKKDQTATMVVPNWRSETPAEVTYKGKFYDFDRLAVALENYGFFEFSNEYSAEVDDANTVIVTAVCNGRRKKIVDYGNGGPLGLSTVEQLIRDAVKGIKWEKPSRVLMARLMARQRKNGISVFPMMN